MTHTALITGGAGFFGTILTNHLLGQGWRCVSIDLCEKTRSEGNFRGVRGDIRDRKLLAQLCREEHFTAIFHCAAFLAHAVTDPHELWSSNVEGTRTIAECAQHFGIPKIVFLSTNCLWGHDMGKALTEDDQPEPIEVYGQSKWDAEKLLQTYTSGTDIVIIRCPTIIDQGRMGLLSILFDFIAEGRKVWVLNGGHNRYQFIAARDLAIACEKAAAYAGSNLFNIGSDNVPSFREVYQSVIDRAGTGARVASVPGSLALPALQAAHVLGISPLGPYQYRMIGGNFSFDTSRIKRELHWAPTMSNQDMLWEAYTYYTNRRHQLAQGDDIPAHRQPAPMGVLQMLKWIS